MAKTEQTAHAEDEHKHVSTQRKHERKTRVLNKGKASLVRSIAEAVVVKDEDVFFLCGRDGRVPLGGKHGLGLYYHDCRFLNGYELTLAGARPSKLVATAARGFMAILELTNPDVRMADGKLLRKEDLGIRWERVLDAAQLALYDQLTFQNNGVEPAQFPISLALGAGFEPIFVVRSLSPEKLGKLHLPAWKDGALSFVYDGSDGIARSLTVSFTPAPQKTDGTTASFQITLQPRESTQVLVSMVIAESKDAAKVEPKPPHPPDLKRVEAALRHSSEQWLAKHTEVHSDSLFLDRVMNRSLRDLRVLRSQLRGHEFFAAGVPWYVTLFGRDSLISSLQTLAYEPGIAEQTLRLLAGYQGTKVDEWRDEQPGKIMHELRVGELAHRDKVPQMPYYGTIDATPLFLILVARHAAWTGDLKVFHDLNGNIERALEWIAKYGDPSGDGYLAYARKSKKGLANQGWKDSGDAIVNADGSLAKPPIALVEVQGYVYLAKTGLADLYQWAGQADRADQLRREAADLRARFNRDFWLDDLGFYALALQAGQKPAAVVASNPGQALWSGIADPEKARRTVDRLMADDMFSGWGIRTFSAKEPRYNPIGYHLGTVWPHDNSIILAGFRRYGAEDAVCRIVTGIIDAAMHFHAYRLPEVFAGFRRDDYSVPVHYPVACHPQAWAAGAVPFMVETLLGLVPEAFDHRLRIVRPILPDTISKVEVRGLRVGPGRADLRFQRGSNGLVTVDVLKVEGPLDVAVEHTKNDQ